MTTTAELVVPCTDQCGEAALWDWRSNTLYWLDLYQPTLHSLSSTRSHQAYAVTGADLLACLLLPPRPGLPRLVSRDAVGDLEIMDSVARFTADKKLLERDPREAINDGKTHPAGVAWLGTADTKEQDGLGRLQVFGQGAPPAHVDSGFVVSNGPAFAPDGRLAYFSDSVARRILRYEVAENGLPAGKGECLAIFSEQDGNPDGLTVDADGHVWVAMWDGWSVRCLDKDGRELARIAVPVQRVTSVAFGGAQLHTLYITTAAIGLDEAAIKQGAGGLFAARPGAVGRREPIARL